MKVSAHHQTGLHGEHSLPVAEVLADLGDNAYYSSELNAAHDFYARSLALERELQPERNPRIQRRLVDLGDVAAGVEDYAQAIKYYEEAREILVIRKKTESLEYAVIQNNLGEMYIAMGRWDDARSSLDQALRISERVQGPEHPEIALTLCSLGKVAAHDSDLVGAEGYFGRALHLVQGLPKHPARRIGEEGLAEVRRLRGVQ